MEVSLERQLEEFLGKLQASNPDYTVVDLARYAEVFRLLHAETPQVDQEFLDKTLFGPLDLPDEQY